MRHVRYPDSKRDFARRKISIDIQENPLPEIGDVTEEVSRKIDYILQEARDYARNPAFKDKVGAAIRHLERKHVAMVRFLESQKKAFTKAQLPERLLKGEAEAIKKITIEVKAFEKAITLIQEKNSI